MRPRSVAISVEGFIGLPGAGKTYALALRGIEAMRQGRRVFSNFGLRGSIPLEVWDHENVGNTKDPGPPCGCGECFVSISHAVVLVDEINLWAPSRMWNALPMGLLHRWAQVRKYETQILWSAQHEARVDKVIREVTGFIWECRATVLGQLPLLHRLPFVPTFRLRAFEPHDLRKVGAQPLSARGLRLKRGIAEAYDTFELVAMGSQFDNGLTAPRRVELPVREARPIMPTAESSEQLASIGPPTPQDSGAALEDEDFDGLRRIGPEDVAAVLEPMETREGPAGGLPADPWGLPNGSSSDREGSRYSESRGSDSRL